MKHEFNVKKYKDATVYTLESASGGGTSAGAVASVSMPMGGVRKRGDNLIAQEEKKEAPKPRNFVAKNAKMGGAGQHKDKKKAEKQGDVKHKKPFAEQGVAEGQGYTIDDEIQHWKDMALHWARMGDEKSMLKCKANLKAAEQKKKQPGVAEGLPQTLRKVVPGHAKREIDRKMDAGKFGKTDADKDANFQRYKKIQDKLKEQGVAEGMFGIEDKIKGKIQNIVSDLSDIPGMWDHSAQTFTPTGLEKLKSVLKNNPKYIKYAVNLTADDYNADLSEQGVAEATGDPKFDKMLKSITGKRAVAKQQKADTKQQARDAFGSMFGGGNPADKLTIRKKGVAEGYGSNRGYQQGFASPTAPSLGQRHRDHDSGDDEPQGMFTVVINGRPWKEFTSNKAFQVAKTIASKNPDKQVQVKWPNGQLNTVKEDHSTASQGYGQGGYDTYANGRHGRGVAENPEWYNDEANEMSSAQLKSLVKHAAKLRKAVKQLQAQGDTLEPWQQSKVTKAADYLDAVFNAVDNEQDMGEGWKSSLAGLGLAGAMALGAGGAHARVTGDEDPGVNRLTGKPNVTQVAPDDVKKPDAGPSLSSRYTQGIEFSSEPYTIKADGKEYKFAGRGADNPGKGKVVKVPAALVGVRGLSAVPVTLNPDGKYYMGGDIDENYMEHLAAQLAEKLNPSEPVDTWVQDFQKANPNKYHQFKNKTPQKKAQMAVAAHYAANEPNKK